MHIVRLHFGLALVALAFMPKVGTAGVTALGPSPYSSRNDSPFIAEENNPNFYLEDFEDGLFNSPGIVLPSNPNAQGIVLPAGDAQSNSVDSDDGLVDGMGRAGRALMSTVYTTNLLEPPAFTSYISLAFDPAVLGALPTEFGFVVTFGQPNSLIRLDIFDRVSNEIGYVTFPGVGNGTNNDSTDDRFFGVRTSDGIGSVLISSTYPGAPAFFEIDHVQYRSTVPEPPCISLLLSVAIIIAPFWRFRRGAGYHLVAARIANRFHT